MKKFIIFASGIHGGGGLVVLTEIIETIKNKQNVLLFLDERSKEKLDRDKLINFKSIVWTKNSVLGRIIAYRKLSKYCEKEDNVLCLNNLPPIFSCKGSIIVYLQNVHIIQPLSFRGWTFLQILRIQAERIIAYYFRKRVDKYIVQTITMKKKLERWYEKDSSKKIPKIEIMPIFKTFKINKKDSLLDDFKEIDFLYVADGQPHKNHENLLKAWQHLSSLGISANLSLTIIKNDQIENKINDMKENGINIQNLGEIDHEDMGMIYANSKALIYPSFFESLGLPLLEASSLNLPIIASELDYVYDVCNPILTFDPNSYLSICRAVTRFLKIKDIKEQSIKPKEALKNIFLIE